MNREQRRRMMRKKTCRKIFREASKKMKGDVEKMFEKKWKDDDDETLNEGDIDGDDYGGDEIYND